MIQELRLNLIKKEVNDNAVTYIKELAKKLQVSESTIRRDVRVLEEMNDVYFLKGGGVKKKTNTEETYNQKVLLNNEEKEIIGKKAAKLVKDGYVVYVDSGTTALYVIKHIKAKGVTIVTSNTMVVNMLPLNNSRCIILGGYIEDRLSSVVGPLTEKTISEMKFDIAFIGANSYSENKGYFTFDEREVRKKKLVINRAKKTYIVADSSKFNRIGIIHFADYCEAQLITEKSDLN